LKARYLPGLLSGELIGNSAVSEPDTGSHVSGPKTRAVLSLAELTRTDDAWEALNASIAKREPNFRGC
jgi:hypothetical protein